DVGGRPGRRRGQRPLLADLPLWKMGAPGLDRDYEGAARALPAFDAHRAAVEADQLLDQGEADSRPFMRARLRSLHAVEPLEHARLLVGGDAHARVRDLQLRVVAAPSQPDGDAPFEGVL